MISGDNFSQPTAQENNLNSSPAFNSPAEEIEFLKNKIAQKQEEMKNFPRPISIESHAKSVILEHKNENLENFKVASDEELYSKNIRAMMASFDKKDNDEKVVELGKIMMQKGVRMAMDAAEKCDPETEDDFHRFLISYLTVGAADEFSSLSKKDWKALHLKLFEIIPPEDDAENAQKTDPKSQIAMMEQFYAALQSVANNSENSEDNYYSLEMAISNGSNSVIFYVAVPENVEAILEKTLQSYFPGIIIRPHKEDYNIFNHLGYQVGAVAKETQDSVLPLKTYKKMEGDPISVIINSFTKLQKDGEGAAVQILVRPAGEKFKKRYGEILNNIQKEGDDFKKALKRNSFIGGLMITANEAFAADEKKEEKKKGYEEAEYQKLIAEKLENTIVDTNIRIFSSAASEARAVQILNDMKATFRQYTENNGNGIDWVDYGIKKLNQESHKFSYRLWDNSESLPLNFSELGTLYHIPSYVKDFHQVKVLKMTEAPAPFDLPQSGTLLGLNSYRGINTKIFMGKEDRMRHFYVIGQTGTGKTTILKNMIVQDILDGHGCCFIDPHGSDVDDILACVPPERYKDVVYFDPASTARPMGLNMLEYDKNFPEQKTFVVNELLGIFNKLFDMKTSGGPGFESMFRNATQLVMDHPESGNTIMEISRVLSDKDYRDYKLSKTKNPIIIQFWQNAEKTTGEQGLSNWVPYINSKIDPFLSNEIMRPIIAQEKSAFNLRDIMDNKKIFLVNLSKGRLGDINANLIGLILVGKFLQAALSRVDSDHRPDFYLYIDEFQNVTTPSIAAILSEARKYRLSLNLAHQYIGQLPEDIKNAVFGNVGSIASFRVGPDDAKYLESQFAPVFNASDIMKIENHNAYLKLLANGTPQKPFNIKTYPTPVGDKSLLSKLKEMSALKYGRPRDEVEEEILRKYSL
jgi:hypothetical protein